MTSRSSLLFAPLPLAALLTLGACGGEASTPDTTQPASKMVNQTPEDSSSATSIYVLRAPSLTGEDVDLSQYEGKVSLVVNVASKCGYTGQYEGLQGLHTDFEDRGFQVLGFPSNDFGGQEPGSADEIASFCSENYGVTFPMFAKVAVKGEECAPIYQRLVAASGEAPTWNFCKYLVGKNGEVLSFWKSGTAPDSAELRAAIEKAL